MAILPTDIPVGTVVGNYYFVSEDNIDVDTDPSLIPVTGNVTFTCSAKVLRMPGKFATVIPLVFKAKFDAQGRLIAVNDPTPGLKLPATNTTDISPRNFTWRVDFDLVQAGNGYSINIPSFDISVPVGETIDLTSVTPVDASPGTITIAGPKGDPNVLSIGTVTTGVPGSPASATITGTSPAQVLSLAIPKGDPGIADDASVANLVNTPASATAGALNATFVPKWKANTAYLAGDAVLSPSGDTVTAKANFTSGASYDSANWNVSAAYVAFGPGASGGDDTARLTAAIAATPVGGRLVLKPDAYSVTSLTLNKAIILDATGATITHAPSGGTAKVILNVTANGAEVRGGVWDGNATNQTSNNSGIVLAGQDNRCTGVTVKNTKFFGILANNARPIIDYCNVSNTGYIGIFAETSGTTLSGGRIAYCTVDRSMLPASSIVEGGLKVHGHSLTDRYDNFQIISPVVFMPASPTDGTALPVELMWSNNSSITDAITTGGTLGISLAGCSNSYATGQAIGASQYGTELAACIDCTVTVIVIGNGVTAKGIDVNGATSARNTILGCHVSGTTNIGIHCETGVVGTQILGGSVSMSVANSAIQLSGGAYSGSTINGVRLNGNSVGTKAIMLDATWGVAIVGNSINGFTQNATLAYATTALTLTDITVLANTIASTPNGALAQQLSGGATLGTNVKAFGNSGTDFLNLGADQRLITGNTGTPEGVYSGSPGSLYLRKDGGAGKTLYFKETGTGNTGWATPGSKMFVGVKTANYTATANDAGSVLIGNGAGLTITLPDPGANGSAVIIVKNINASALTVATAAGTIDGVATASLAQNASAWYISDGAVWRAI